MIVSEDETLAICLQELREHLKHRGYTDRIIGQQFDRVLSVPRESLCSVVSNKNAVKRTPLVTTWESFF